VRTAQTKQVKARIEGLKATIQRSRFAHYPPVVLIWRTGRDMVDDDATHLAAAIAYYAIFSLFPLFLGFLAIINWPSPELPESPAELPGLRLPKSARRSRAS
jgi:hypothetical protein